MIPPAGSVRNRDAKGCDLCGSDATSRGVVYDLGRPEAPPRPFGTGGRGCRTGLPANARAFLFSERPILWTAWVEQWERDQAGKGHEPALLPDVRCCTCWRVTRSPSPPQPQSGPHKGARGSRKGVIV